MAGWTKLLLLCALFSFGFVTQAKPNPKLSAATKAEAAQLARQQAGGKVLKVQFLKKAKPPVYKVKLITERGTVKTLTILAKEP